MNAKSDPKRPGDPRETAEVAASLASDRASYVTGTIVPGRCLMVGVHGLNGEGMLRACVSGINKGSSRMTV